MTTSRAKQRPSLDRYPTLNESEAANVFGLEIIIEEVERDIASLQRKRDGFAKERSEVFETAAERATSIEEIAEVYRTTGRRRDDVVEWAKALHPAINGFSPFGIIEKTHMWLVPEVRFYRTHYDASNAATPANLAAAMREFVRIVEPTPIVIEASLDKRWAENFQGWHSTTSIHGPGDYFDGKDAYIYFTRTTEGDDLAVLTDQRYADTTWTPEDEIYLARGTLAEVLAETHRLAHAEWDAEKVAWV